MRAAQTAARLTEFAGRGAGTDAERRAAGWLAGETRSPTRDTFVETFWCRPNWALAHAWHSLLAVAGSLLIVSHPRLGGTVQLAALVCVVLDAVTGASPGRRLTREHASQNVVSRTRDRARPVRLLVTANYDTGRTGIVYRDGLRAAGAWLKRRAGNGRLTPGWMGWLVVAIVWLMVIAVLRDAGMDGTAVSIAQLIPTAALVVGLGALLEAAMSPFGPGAGDNAAGAAVAVALVRALDAAPPRHVGVELVLQGAGDGGMAGLRRHLRARRSELRRETTIVLGIGGCGAGRPCWWVSDGSLVPLRYAAALRELADVVGASGNGSRARPYRSRGIAPALPARLRHLPALAIGCVDHRGLAPRSHQAGDLASAVDPAAADALLEFALTLVDAIDANVAAPGANGRSAVAPAAA